jgi:hypothetical protein
LSYFYVRGIFGNMHCNLLKYLCLFLGIFLGSELFAQDVHIYGQLKDEKTKKKLDGCLVQVMKDGAIYDSYDAAGSGKYDFKLPVGFAYDIKFSKGDYLSKVVRVDTRNIPEEDVGGGFDMQVDGTLFPSVEGFNTDILRDPMAIAKYNKAADTFEFDFDYTEKKQKEIDAEFKRLEDIKKNFEKLKADFDRYVKEGDQKMLEKNYSESVMNYKSALAIFPKDEPVKAKLADAQAKLDAANAANAEDALYKKTIEEGDQLYKDGKYAEAKKKFIKARDMRNNTYEKEMIYKCDQALDDAANRAVYDAVIADADKKFNNKDFAVSIEKYKEASKMYPTESYPKDQMLKAEGALKDMLAYEAEKLRIQKEYDDKLALAARNVDEDKIDQAISNYRAASQMKPEEQFPKDKISELEALLAERKSQQEKNDADALANAERDRIEREYNDILKQADDLFIAEQLEESRLKYEAALVVKPGAQYPASKIETIDLLLAQRLEMDALAASKAVEDSLAAIAEAERLAADERLRLLREQEELDNQRRMRELEEQRLAEEAKLKAKRSNWYSNVDEEAEDQVVEYYREAFEKEYATKKKMKQQEIDDFVAFNSTRQKDADQLIAGNRQSIEGQRQNQMELVSIGTSIQNAAIADNNRKKKDTDKDREEYQRSANSRINDNVEFIGDKMEQQASVAQADRARTIGIDKTDDKKQQQANNNERFRRKGDTQIAENNLKVKRTIDSQEEMAFEGEEVRKSNEESVRRKHEDANIRENDERQAADQRIVNSNLKIESKKQQNDQLDDGKDINQRKNANEIEKAKKDYEYSEMELEMESANKRYDSRNAAFEKKAGEPKDEKEYLAVPGTEELKEGVTEKSYQLGNKMVTERSVKVGNKVDNYKKVVSKTGIYYFCNGRSITESTWRTATLSEPE